MSSLMEKGRITSKDGDLWVPKICPETMCFIGCHCQWSKMADYARTYVSAFAIGDGTFNTNMYKFTNFPWVTPCCLVLCE